MSRKTRFSNPIDGLRWKIWIFWNVACVLVLFLPVMERWPKATGRGWRKRASLTSYSIVGTRWKKKERKKGRKSSPLDREKKRKKNCLVTFCHACLPHITAWNSGDAEGGGVQHATTRKYRLAREEEEKDDRACADRSRGTCQGECNPLYNSLVVKSFWIYIYKECCKIWICRHSCINCWQERIVW